MLPNKHQHYTRFPVCKYTTEMKKKQEELTQKLVAENKKLEGKQAKLKRLQSKVSLETIKLLFSST